MPYLGEFLGTMILILLGDGVVANVLLNLVMVLAFHQGALGVGVATSASQWIACIMIVLFMRQKDNPCHIDFGKLRVDFKILKKIFLIGIPAGIQNSLFALSNVTIQSSINSLGKVVFAAGCALITVLIRFFGTLPEGVSYAILLMNILSPYIEKLCARKPLGAGGKSK